MYMSSCINTYAGDEWIHAEKFWQSMNMMITSCILCRNDNCRERIGMAICCIRNLTQCVKVGCRSRPTCLLAPSHSSSHIHSAKNLWMILGQLQRLRRSDTTPCSAGRAPSSAHPLRPSSHPSSISFQIPISNFHVNPPASSLLCMCVNLRTWPALSIFPCLCLSMSKPFF